MKPKPLSLGIKSNPDRDSEAAQLINCYAENAGAEGKIKFPIYACDGYAAFSTLTGTGAGVIRGMFNLDDTTLYVVTGTRINRVNTSGTATDMGALATSGIAYMTRNRKSPNAQIGIVTSDGLFRIISNNSVSTPTLDASIPTFNSIASLDGYFIFTASNGEWFISSIDEGATIDPLDFAQANSNPDGAVRAIVRGRDVIIAGPRSMEFYQNTGAANFPFERSSTTNMGVYAAPSMVNLMAGIDGSTTDTIAWIATNSNGDLAGVMLLDGYQGRKISPPKLDRLLAAATASTIRAFTYARQGHTFYCLTSSTFTWEYNATTGLWHERKSSGLEYWRVVDACAFNGGTIFGDYTSAALYSASSSITPASASTVSLRHSDDLGTSWTAARTKALGPAGDEKTRVKFTRLGQSKKDGKVLEISISNAVMEAGTGVAMTIIPPPITAFPDPIRMPTLWIDCSMGASLTTRSKGVRGLAADVMAVDG